MEEKAKTCEELVVREVIEARAELKEMNNQLDKAYKTIAHANQILQIIDKILTVDVDADAGIARLGCAEAAIDLKTENGKKVYDMLASVFVDKFTAARAGGDVGADTGSGDADGDGDADKK